MSEFSPEGFDTFPNTYEDNNRIGSVSEWTEEQLNNKCQEYVVFIQRTDLMPRAILIGNRVLDHIIFEMGYRDGVYDPIIAKVEDHLCGES